MAKIDSTNYATNAMSSTPKDGHATATSIFEFAPQADPTGGGGDGGATPTAGGLQLVRLSRDRLIGVAFTMEGTEVMLHYCPEPELNGYVQCNGDECALCLCGKEGRTRFLIPLYLPAYDAVHVLAVSQSMAPGSLLPQLQAIFQSQSNQWPLMLFLSKVSNFEFSIIPHPTAGAKFQGHPTINAFVERFQSNREILSSVFPKIENAALSMVPEIKRILNLLESDDALDR